MFGELKTHIHTHTYTMSSKQMDVRSGRDKVSGQPTVPFLLSLFRESKMRRMPMFFLSPAGNTDDVEE